MNNYKQGRIFTAALNKADTGDTDMSAEDWAQACGLMANYGHGYEFADFTEEEAIKAIEQAARDLEEQAAEIEQ